MQERRVASLIQGARRQAKNGLGRIFLARGEAIAVELKKQNADHETGSFVAIDERMVADNPAV